MRKPLVVVTAGPSIPIAIIEAHAAALIRSVPYGWAVEYAATDNHAGSILRTLEREADSPSVCRPVLFQDVDCLAPLSAYERALDDFDRSALAGLAQAACHISPERVYAGPAFLVIDPGIWHLCGRPSPFPDAENDVAQRISDEWCEEPVLYRPMSWDPCGPVWRAGKDRFSWDTTYENGVYHAFCIRDPGPRQTAFVQRCKRWGANGEET